MAASLTVIVDGNKYNNKRSLEDLVDETNRHEEDNDDCPNPSTAESNELPRHDDDDGQQEESLPTLCTALNIIFVQEGFLTLHDVQVLMNSCHSVLTLFRQSSGWQQYIHDDTSGRIAGLAPPPGTQITQAWPVLSPTVQSNDDDEDNETHNPYAFLDLYIPPRMPRNDGPKGYVMATIPQDACFSKLPLQRFNSKTGALGDLYFPSMDNDNDAQAVTANKVIPNPLGLPVYVERSLPIACTTCQVSCKTYKDFYQHVTSVQHQTAHLPLNQQITNPNIPTDPRLMPTFSNGSPYDKVKACLEYQHAIVKHLRTTVSEDGRQVLQKQCEWITGRAARQGLSLEPCTVQHVTAACVEMVVQDFRDNGVALYSLARTVLVGGWEAFTTSGSISDECLFEYVLFGKVLEDDYSKDDELIMPSDRHLSCLSSPTLPPTITRMVTGNRFVLFDNDGKNEPAERRGLSGDLSTSEKCVGDGPALEDEKSDPPKKRRFTSMSSSVGDGPSLEDEKGDPPKKGRRLSSMSNSVGSVLSTNDENRRPKRRRSSCVRYKI